MGKGKAWDAAELRVLALSYANATYNPQQGADQRNEVFMSTLMKNIRHWAPAGPRPGQYENRGDQAIYVFIRDHLKPEMNKFNIALRAVLATEPTGVSEEQKVNMAIAIHLEKTNHMEYKYKDQNPYEWKFFNAWRVLRTTSKFRVPQAGAVRGRDYDWNVVNNETVADNSQNVMENENVAYANNENSNENFPENEAFNLKRASRGKAKGQKATKRAKIAKQGSSRKEHELKKLNNISERRVQNQEKSNQIMGIRTLLQYSTDEVERAQLLQELRAILSSPNQTVRVDSSCTNSEVLSSDND